MNGKNLSEPEIISLLSHLNITAPPVCYLTPSLEPIQSHHVQQLIFLVYTLTSILSVLGNLLVILVQLCGSKNCSQNIGKYLNNLAISDIMIAVMSAPFTYTNIVRGRWTFADWLCPLVQYSQLLSVFITSTTLTIIGIERYLVTLHPLSRITEWLKSHTSFLLCLTWLVGAFYAAIPLEATQTSQFLHGNQVHSQCIFNQKANPLKLRLFIVINFLLTFLLPLAIMVFSYLAIMKKLNANSYFIAKDLSTSSKQCTWIFVVGQGDVPQEMRLTSSIDQRSKTIKMMLTVLIMYCVCWAPLKIFQCLQNYGIIKFCTETEFYVMIYSYLSCHWLAMANSFINPIIYSFQSKTYRRNFCKILCTFKWF